MVLVCESKIHRPVRYGYDSLIPLLAVDVKVEIVDNCGTCTVFQKYKNNYSSAIEATYGFNLSSGDVVTSMSMIIGSRVLKSVISEKSEARETYNEAKSEGHTTCLLEKLPNNQYKMNVGNLDPGVEVVIEYTYLTVTSCENDAYKFVLPTNIAPKYDGSSNKTVEDMISSENGKLTYNVNAQYTFSISIHWTSVNKITGIESMTNKIEVAPVGTAENEVVITSSTVPSRGDFNIFVSSAFSPSVYVHHDASDAYMMLNHHIPAEELPSEGKEYIFVLDRSGSMRQHCDSWTGAVMNGSNNVNKTKMSHAIDALKLFMESLPPNSKFNVVSFGNTYAALFSKSVEYNNANKKQCLDAVAGFDANMGGTEIFKCLSDILEGNIRTFKNKCSEDLSQRKWTPSQTNSVSTGNAVQSKSSKPMPMEKIIVLLTDGQVSNTNAVVDLCRRYDHVCRVFCVGIGSDVDRNLVESVARVTNGQSEIMVDSADIDTVVIKMLDATSKAYYTDVTVQYLTQNGSTVIPSHTSSKALYPDTTMNLFTKTTGDLFRQLVGIRVTGKHGVTGAPISWDMDRSALEIAQSVSSPYLIKQLWASDAINSKALSKREVIRLSIDCDVMNEFTSFVVVDPVKTDQNRRGNPVSVAVPQHPGNYNNNGVCRRVFSTPVSTATSTLRNCSFGSAPVPCGMGGRGGGGAMNFFGSGFSGFAGSRMKSSAQNHTLGVSSEKKAKKRSVNRDEGSATNALNAKLPPPPSGNIPSAPGFSFSARGPPPGAAAPQQADYLCDMECDDDDEDCDSSNGSDAGLDLFSGPSKATNSAPQVVSQSVPMNVQEFNVVGLLQSRNTDGSFQRTSRSMVDAQCAESLLSSLLSQYGSVFTMDLLFNIVILARLENLHEAKYALVLRNLRAWVTKHYPIGASVQLDKLTSELVLT